MTRAISLIRLTPDFGALAQWALRHRYAQKRGGQDFGYALHAALLEVLGNRAPRPFVYREPGTPSGTRPTELLGYCDGQSDSVEAHARSIDLSTNIAKALRPHSLTARTMPSTWPAGHRLTFEVRTRPVIRARANGRDGPSCEIDAAAWACRQAEDRGTPAPTKEAVYQDWLRMRLGAQGCDIRHARPVRIRRTRVLRRPGHQGARRPVMIEGPDVLFRGELLIRDPAAFAAAFRRGVGRHAAFGFGCLLLAPAGTYD